MTIINYTYAITRVDPEAKAMDIEYSAPGYGTLLVGARMPWAGETVEDVVRSFAPVRYWIEQSLQVAPVSPGTAGQIAEDLTPTQVPRSVSKLALVRAMRDVTYTDGRDLWTVAKEALAMADDATKEDWEMASTIQDNDQVFVAMATTLYGEQAQEMIQTLFDEAGGA